MKGASPSPVVLRAVELLKNSRHTVVLSGAGISTPSGIPDFRSANTGLWQKSDPMEVASLTAFRYRPQKFFDWLRPLASSIVDAQPNPAHTALAHMERSGHIEAVITQNIDGLHQKAGSQNVIEVHGSMTDLECLKCKHSFPSIDFYKVFVETNELPRCPDCREILKPGIVLFEEMLPWKAWDKAENYAMHADLFLVIGSSLEVTPASHLPMYAVQNGARLIIINFTPTYLDEQAEVILPFDVAEILPQISENL